MKTIVFVFYAVLSMAAIAGQLTDKIAQKHRIIATDKFYGFNRTQFEFMGCTAWVVEPSVTPHKSKPWTWTMQWATAFVARTPVLHLLKSGWHHVTIDTYRYKMNSQGLNVSKAFQEYLVSELGFASKAALIGMSWGGFFSTRYAASHPENVLAIYYDCPLFNFAKYAGYTRPGLNKIGPWANSVPKDWTQDPRMPVNMAESVAKAGIPVYLIYGGSDNVVAPDENSELFISRFKAAKGNIKVVCRGAYGHHPHGLEIDDTTLADFFANAFEKTESKK